MRTCFVLLSLLSIATGCSAQNILLRFETWSTDLVAEDRVLQVDLDESGQVSIHRPAHWRNPGRCEAQVDQGKFANLQAAMAKLPFQLRRGDELKSLVAHRDRTNREQKGQLFERSEAVLTVITRYPARRSSADVFAYRDLDWDSQRYPELTELRDWQLLAGELYALARDANCPKSNQERAP